MRVAQPVGLRGSQKWIQRAVNEGEFDFDRLVSEGLPGLGKVSWRSPRVDDDYAEYRDASFLRRIGRDDLASALASFWPSRGPQWDALGLTDTGQVLLVEAKAHVGELLSLGTQAGDASRARISAALNEVASDLGAKPLVHWADAFYQLANRIAHLWLLRRERVDARLLLVDFVGDRDMEGPMCGETWDAAYFVVEHVLGLPWRHRLSPYIVHVRPSVIQDCAGGG